MQKIPHVESGTYLFRFFNHRAEHFWPAVEDILSHQTLFLNSRVNFNDPYDSQPVIVDDLSNRAIRQNLSEALRNPLPPKRSWQAVARALDMNSNGKTSFKKTEIENIKIALRKNAEQHLDSAGLLSFSLTAENPLLWGHYAASFGGVCAVFRRGHSLRSCLALCAKVSYVDKRPQLSLSLIRQMSRRWMVDEPHDELANEIFFVSFLHKSQHWDYEQEARIFCPQGAFKKLKYEPSEFVGFILGPNSSPDLENRLRLEIKSRRPSASLDRAFLSQSEYQIIGPHKFVQHQVHVAA
jgi:hypothetical protein